jgi:hypothetical protein
MKIYLAGQCPYPEARLYAEQKHKRFLHSYAYMKRKKIAELRQWWRGQDIMLDSGGFTVRTAGGHIDISAYRSFLILLNGSFSSCINLDTASVEESLRNQRFLEAGRKLRPMPVYHYSDWMSPEHRHLLQQFIDDGYDYISLGGVAGVSKMTKDGVRRFYDFCFRLSEKSIKLHGLGMTSVALMSYFPFYSVDSKTWLVSGLYGDFVTTKNAKYKRTPKKRGSISHYGVMLPGAEKMKRAVDAFIQLERHLTAIWEKRGYTWN